jgi:hypothetical protein
MDCQKIEQAHSAQAFAAGGQTIDEASTGSDVR